MNGKDCYAVLGVPRDASLPGIRRAFRELARRHHPDLSETGGAEGAGAFREVVEAYRVLSDTEKRREHDAWLRTRERSGHYRERERAREGAGARAARPTTPRGFADPAEPEMPARPLCCDITLSAAEARRGGTLPVRIPMRAGCRTCRGPGSRRPFACPHCGGRGSVDTEVVMRLHIPAGVRSGSVFETRWLRVRVDVAPSAEW